jgi:MinD-like ATPase involved in chromosome partitioning or flagellar assembly
MGEIITFYSYKGGTGRTMALANVAWILAAAGNRVLMVDWDLEAPGLHRYFYPFLRDKELVTSTGVMDIVMDFMIQAMTPPSSEQDKEKTWYLRYADVLRHAVSIDWDFGKGQLDLLPAGRQSASYATHVNSFNWDNFYERLGGGTFLEAMRASMLREYDYVLIDSRTGVSDTSGICTVQLPDKIVVCFTFNRQSIEGAASVAHSIVEARARAGRPETQVFPVPTRVEKAETLRLDAARAASRARFAGILSHVPEDGRPRYWDESEVAYQPYYAYEELLAAFGDPSPRVGSLLHTMQRLAARLIGEPELAWQPVPAEKRIQVLSQYGWANSAATPKAATEPALEAAPIRTSPRSVSTKAVARPVYSFFASYARPDRLDAAGRHLETFVRDLGELVQRRSADDAPPFFDPELAPISDAWQTGVAEAIAGCRAAVCLVSPTYVRSEQCGREFAALQRQEVPIFPVCWVPVHEPLLPAPLHDTVVGRHDRTIDRSGLHAVMRIGRYDRVYRDFIQDLAEHIARAPSKLPRAPVRWEETPNAFAMSAQAMIGTQVVAACVAPAVEGPGGWDWRPYGSAPLGALIQRAALEEGFTAVMTSLTPSFADEIRDRIGLIVVASTIEKPLPATEILQQIGKLATPTLSMVFVVSRARNTGSHVHDLGWLQPFVSGARNTGSHVHELDWLQQLSSPAPSTQAKPLSSSSSSSVLQAGDEEGFVRVIRQELVKLRGRALQEAAARAPSAAALPRPIPHPTRAGEDE